MHIIEHLLGLDSPNSPLYLFWSGIGGYLLVILGGVKGYFKLKKHHEQHIDSLHNHIDQRLNNLTEKNDA